MPKPLFSLMPRSLLSFDPLPTFLNVHTSKTCISRMLRASLSVNSLYGRCCCNNNLERKPFSYITRKIRGRVCRTFGCMSIFQKNTGSATKVRMTETERVAEL